jgi:hypothetical protein
LTILLFVGVENTDKSHHREEPTEQVVSEQIQHEHTRPQDPEDGTILIILFCKFCVSNLFIILNYVL